MKPNVLILMVDQLNYKCLGFKQHPIVKTPNLDLLKQDSVEFTRCYVQNAFCVPSRTSYMTGQYLFTHRQYGFHGLLSEDTPSMPEFFQKNGYNTFHSGKSHLNCMDEHLGFSEALHTIPEDIPFSTYPDRNYMAYCQDKGYKYPTDQIHGGQGIGIVKHRRTSIEGNVGADIGSSHIPVEDSVEAYTTNQAIHFLQNQKNEPFFLNVSFDRPHPPISPSEPFDCFYDPESIPLSKEYTEEQLEKLPKHIQKIARQSPYSLKMMGDSNMKNLLALYYGLITHIDEEMGRIISSLKKQGLYDNTIILFYSDHGDTAGYKGLFNKYSNTLFHDDIIRTPMLLKLASQECAGMEIESLTEAIDVFPTIAAICSLNTSGLPLQGENLLKYLHSHSIDAKKTAFSESYSIKTVVQGEWKLIYYVNSNEGELYHFDTDSEERYNVFGEPANRSKVIQLKLEIIKKMTKSVSEQRKQYIRNLVEPGEKSMMEKLHKWTRNIADGGGFWTICRDEYRLFCIPFDDRLILQKLDPQQVVIDERTGFIPYDNDEKLEELLNELLNYIATTIRPISLMTGGQQGWDNMLQTKGFGLC